MTSPIGSPASASSFRSHSPARARAPGAALLACAFGAFTVLGPLHATEARADEVSPKGKGITGGALLGAEVVTMVESFAGVRAGWAYGVGALAGAAGGGVGGFFVEKGNTDGRVPTYMLAGGLALIIPAVILTLNATRYQPEEGASEDKAPTAPAAEPGGGTGAPTVPPPDVVPPATTPAAPAPTPPPAAPQSRRAPATHPGRAASGQMVIRPSLVDVREGGLRLGVPLPDVLAVFSIEEQRQYGMRSETELRLPVLHVTF